MTERSDDFVLLNIGYSNVVFVSKMVGILAADSAGARRLRTEAKENGNLVDATMGRRTRSVIVTTSQHIFLSAIKPESLARRIDRRDNTIGNDEEENIDEDKQS